MRGIPQHLYSTRTRYSHTKSVPPSPRLSPGRTGGPFRSLLTVSEVWGETGKKSFSGDFVRHQKSLHAIRLRSCLRAIRRPKERRGIRHRWERLALVGAN